MITARRRAAGPRLQAGVRQLREEQAVRPQQVRLPALGVEGVEQATTPQAIELVLLEVAQELMVEAVEAAELELWVATEVTAELEPPVSLL